MTIHLIAHPAPPRPLGDPRWTVEWVETGRTFGASPHAFYAACRTLLNELKTPDAEVRAVFADRPSKVIEMTLGRAAGLRLEIRNGATVLRKWETRKR